MVNDLTDGLKYALFSRPSRTRTQLLYLFRS